MSHHITDNNVFDYCTTKKAGQKVTGRAIVTSRAIDRFSELEFTHLQGGELCRNFVPF